MLAIAYVILPVTDLTPADAIRASLCGFQKANNGDLCDELRVLDDRTEAPRRLHEMPLRITDDDDGLRIEGGEDVRHHLDNIRLRKEMRRRGLRTWRVRLADMTDFHTFLVSFCLGVERHPVTGQYHWPDLVQGKWNWWDLGGTSDGCIIGEPHRGPRRLVARISSGEHLGRMAMSAPRKGPG